MIDRRRLLLATAAAGAAGAAGCIDAFAADDPGASDEGDGDPNGDDGDAENVASQLLDDVADGFVLGYQIESYRASNLQESEADAEELRDASHAAEYLDLDERDESERETLQSLVDETDFESEHLFAFEARGPNLCYDLQLESVAATEDDGLELDAAVVDESGEDEACGEALVQLGLLVRVVYEDDAEKPGSGTVSMSGPGWGTGFSWASESDSGHADEGASGDRAGDDSSGSDQEGDGG